MDASIDLTGSTLDIKNDHVSDNTKKTYHLCLTQFMLYLFYKHQELLSFVGPLIIANEKDGGNKSRRFLRQECNKQLKEMNRSNGLSPIKIQGDVLIDES